MSPIKDEDISRRLDEAERLYKKHYSVEKPKSKDYLKTFCPKCQKKVEYRPKKDWNGMLKCPHCYEVFRLTRLEDFSKDINS